MSILLQDALVTGVAVAAASVILRRLVSFAQPRRPGQTPCGSCGSRRSACAPTAPQQPAAPVPLVLHRRPPAA